jgi:uncharacterized protein YrrD
VSDPVSWFLIEKGWRVIGSDEKELGKVHEVIGDSDKDIFNGLAVTPGLLRAARYVPSERVREITEGRVVLDLDSRDFERLNEHGEMPTSAHVRADTTDL